ncbi:MAG: hypothetical protein ACSHXY_11105 [Alphaproteobacteria bacterium]
MWDILGLEEPTGDLRVIKKAYAKKLRVTRPEDDAAAFMALRDALEQAKHYAAFNNSQGHDVFIEKQSADSIDDNFSAPLPVRAVVSGIDESPHYRENISPVEALIANIEALLKEPFARTSHAKWAEIFNDDRLDPIDTMIDFEDAFRNFLLGLFGYFDGDTSKANKSRHPALISTRIGTLIFTTMGWREAHGRPLYIQDQIEWLRQDLDVLNQSKIWPVHQQPVSIEESDDSYIWLAVKVVLVIFIVWGINYVL